MDTWLPVLVGLIAGVVGYLATTFWYQPIIRLRQVRADIITDIIFYANVINADGLNEEMKQRYLDRQVSNRKNAASLVAVLRNLPLWYVWWLSKRGVALGKAASELIGLSNTKDYDTADKRIRRIQKFLGVDPPIEM